MNVKKFLKEKAKQDRDALLTDTDEIFFKNLKYRVEDDSMHRRKSLSRVWVSSLMGATAMILVIVSVLVFYPRSDNEIKYLESNFKYITSNLEETQNSLHDFSINIDLSVFSCTVDKVIDSVSGDTIYYTLKIQSYDTIKSMEFVVVTNENYEYRAFEDTRNFISVENSSYSFIYSTGKSIDEEFGLEVLNVKAELHKAKEYIYVLKYKELLFDPDGSFIETIQQIIE